MIFGLAATASSAVWAQSSVVLYGIVDAGVRYASYSGPMPSNDSSLWQLAQGGMANSRLGVNVNEDVNAGLKVIANLEHRFNSDTGAQSAAEFWRQSWVGLQSNQYGRLTIGRQYNLMFDAATSSYASFNYSPYIGFSPEFGLSMGTRQDNMLKYTADMGGLRGSIQLSAGEGNAPNKSRGGHLRYAAAELAVAGAYLEVFDTAGKRVKGLTMGGSWTAGPLYVVAAWARNEFDQGSLLGELFTRGLSGPNVLAPSANDVKLRSMVSGGLTYQFTPQFNLGGHYWRSTQTHQLTATTSKGDFFAAVADYAFSPRTDLYAEFDFTDFSGKVSFANAATRRYGTTLGLRHRF
ncbi:porin [Roseateles oligotrophus]|uniref:Porin n=1 Tax=Roseateles oligotrophus TaxID=1769250 RepID=A0ABT2YKC4_9BURK|nr:porin [Roseateles oligotrophus]MCV2370506.1 porin [Roseateles oligotrophus]